MTPSTAQHRLDPAHLERAAHHLRTYGHLSRAGQATRTWVDEQVRQLRASDLPTRAVRQLRSVGITADTPTQLERDRDRAWRRFLEELDWWVAKHGTAQVPQHATSRKVDGQPYTLGLRVKNYRALHRRGELDPSKAIELEQHPGWTWNAHDGAWTSHLEHLRTIHDQQGHLSQLPTPLERWLRNQRQAPLTEEQQQQLAQLPGALGPLNRSVVTFLAAARAWLEQQPPGTPMTAIRYDATVEINGQTVPVGRRVTYYRDRYRGNAGTNPLNTATIDAIAALPGWSWESEDRRKRRTAAT